MLTAGSGIWNQAIEKSAKKAARGYKPTSTESSKPDTLRPPKPIKQMTMAEYKKWRDGTGVQY